jgi:hypothetical protein
MVLWKSAAREVAREGLQAFPRFRLENVNPDGLILSAVLGDRRVAGGLDLEVAAHQIV